MAKNNPNDGTGVAASPFNPIKVEIILWLSFGFIIWGLAESLAPRYTLGTLLIFAVSFSVRITYAARKIVAQHSTK